jgi:hypothetical protein
MMSDEGIVLGYGGGRHHGRQLRQRLRLSTCSVLSLHWQMGNLSMIVNSNTAYMEQLQQYLQDIGVALCHELSGVVLCHELLSSHHMVLVDMCTNVDRNGIR